MNLRLWRSHCRCLETENQPLRIHGARICPGPCRAELSPHLAPLSQSSPWLWVSSFGEGIKMPDAEKMATEMGFSGAQAKEAAAWIRSVRHLHGIYLQSTVTKAETLQYSRTAQCRFRRWRLSEATLMANLYKDGISYHTGTKRHAAGPHSDLRHLSF